MSWLNNLNCAFLLLLIFLMLSFSVSASIVGEAKILQDKVQDFIDSDDTVIVIGDYASKAERIAFSAMKEEDPRIAKFPVYTEEEIKENPSLKEGMSVFYVGGPMQNRQTKTLLETSEITQTEDTLSIGKLVYVTTSSGEKHIVFSDLSGFENLPKTGIEKSPLAKFMPLKYVPVAATAIGFTLIWLWKFLFIFAKKITSKIVASKLMRYVKKKELKEDFKGLKVRGIRIKFREWWSIFLAATIFAVAASYIYLSPEMDVLIFLITNILVNMVVYTIRHFTRIFMDRHHELHTEYVVWWWGALITIVTGWLGNTFSMAGYTIADKKLSERKEQFEGRIQFVINMLSFCLFLICFFWNLFAPSKFIQMSMILALAITFIQMLPFNPFGGAKIYYWSKTWWWITFIAVAVFYFPVQVLF